MKKLLFVCFAGFIWSTFASAGAGSFFSSFSSMSNDRHAQIEKQVNGEQISIAERINFK